MMLKGDAAMAKDTFGVQQEVDIGAIPLGPLWLRMVWRPGPNGTAVVRFNLDMPTETVGAILRRLAGAMATSASHMLSYQRAAISSIRGQPKNERQ